MIDAIITFSIRNRAWVVGASLVLAVLGAWTAWETPVDAIPDLSENQVIVFTEWKGHGPREIEEQVTYPLTLGLRGLAGVRVVRSSSDVGFSMISVIFDDQADLGEGRRRFAVDRQIMLAAKLDCGMAHVDRDLLARRAGAVTQLGGSQPDRGDARLCRRADAK